MSDPQTSAFLDVLKNPDISSREAFDAFNGAMHCALNALDDTCNGKLLQAHKEPNTCRPPRARNPWYNTDCKRLRTALHAAERSHGADSADAMAARHEYWRCVRSSRRQFERARAMDMVEKYVADPRQFWSQFRGGNSSSASIDMQKWTSYFENLFSGVAVSEYHNGDLKSHCEHYAELFGLPSHEAVKAAADLSNPFSTKDVLAVLNGLSNHKAAGVDGRVYLQSFTSMRVTLLMMGSGST